MKYAKYIDNSKYKRVVKEIRIVIAQIHYSSINKAPACVLCLCFFFLFSGKLNKNIQGREN